MYFMSRQELTETNEKEVLTDVALYDILGTCTVSWFVIQNGMRMAKGWDLLVAVDHILES